MDRKGDGFGMRERSGGGEKVMEEGRGMERREMGYGWREIG